MPQFRKKPVSVEAEQFNVVDGPRIAEWCRGKYVSHPDESSQIRIPTLEGVMTANIGDWIIQGVHGEFYPCRNDIFEETYSEIREDDDNLVESLRSMAEIIERSRGAAVVAMLSGDIFDEAAGEIERLTVQVSELLAQRHENTVAAMQDRNST